MSCKYCITQEKGNAKQKVKKDDLVTHLSRANRPNNSK